MHMCVQMHTCKEGVCMCVYECTHVRSGYAPVYKFTHVRSGYVPEGTCVSMYTYAAG